MCNQTYNNQSQGEGKCLEKRQTYFTRYCLMQSRPKNISESATSSSGVECEIYTNAGNEEVNTHNNVDGNVDHGRHKQLQNFNHLDLDSQHDPCYYFIIVSSKPGFPGCGSVQTLVVPRGRRDCTRELFSFQLWWKTDLNNLFFRTLGVQVKMKLNPYQK